VHPLILDIGEDAGFYLVPPVAGTGLKVGDHRFTLTGDPDDPRDAPRGSRGRLRHCHDRLADFDRYRLASARVCYYAVEPEERFVLEPLAGPGSWPPARATPSSSARCWASGWRRPSTGGEGAELSRWAAGGAARPI
jgi:hypothetical protein